MDHAPKGWVSIEAAKNARTVGGLRDISALDHYLRSSLLHSPDGRECVGGGHAASNQHEIPRAALCHPSGYLQTQASEAAGDQIRCVRRDFRICRYAFCRVSHDASYMPDSLPVRDLIVASTRLEFLNEKGKFIFAGRFEINEPSPKFRMFERNHASQAPERGAGQSCRTAVNRVRAAGHNPERWGSRKSMSNYRLQHVQYTARRDYLRLTDRLPVIGSR